MRYFLGLGSNLGDRMGNLKGAVDSLGTKGVRLIRSSSVYETDPVGGPEGQGPFLNAVIEVESELDPRGMLLVCSQLEAEAARVRTERWGPRTLDVDILMADGLEVHEIDLEIPHPRMTQRDFVMIPLAEIDPDAFPHPGLATNARKVGTLI